MTDTNTTLFTAPDEPVVTMRSPADLVDALPYLLGYHPDDSIVVVALHGPRKRLGGRIRLDLPEDPAAWPAVAPQLAEQLVVSGEAREGRPDGALVYLCGPGSGPPPPDDPSAAASPSGNPSANPAGVRSRLGPLASQLRSAFARYGIPVLDVLVVASGRWWSVNCEREGCCPPEGTPLAVRGRTSPIAAAAAYAGISVRGSLTELDARLAPVSFLAAESQRQALDRMVGAAVGEIVEAQGIDGFRTESIRLLREEFDRVRADPALPRAVEEDAELDEERAARLILGLQDKPTRDRAAEWVEPGEVPAARRLWRTLARRCVSPYQEHAAAPLTLLGWACWADADDTAARVALNRALRVAPDYGFAALLHQAVNLGLSPEPLFAALRDERRSREREGPAVPAATEPAAPARPTGGVSLERPVRRRLGRRVGRPPGRRPDRGPDRGAGRRAEPPAEHSVRPGPGPCR